MRDKQLAAVFSIVMACCMVVVAFGMAAVW